MPSGRLFILHILITYIPVFYIAICRLSLQYTQEGIQDGIMLRFCLCSGSEIEIISLHSSLLYHLKVKKTQSKLSAAVKNLLNISMCT